MRNYCKLSKCVAFRIRIVLTSCRAAKQEAEKITEDYGIVVLGWGTAKINKNRTRVRTTAARWRLKEEELIRFEEEHNIAERWTPRSPEYIDTSKLLSERTYRRAVDNLERLVVQRLLELTKLGMNGVGESYILHSKISVHHLARL